MVIGRPPAREGVGDGIADVLQVVAGEALREVLVAVPDGVDEAEVFGVVPGTVGVLVPDLDLVQAAALEERLDGLAEEPVSRGLREDDVEVQVGRGDAGRWPERVVGRRGESREVGIGAMPSREGGDRRFERQAGVGEFQGGAEVAARGVRVSDHAPADAVADVGARTVAEAHHVDGLESAERLAHRRRGHAEALCELPRGRQGVARLELLGADDLHDAVRDPLGQGPRRLIHKVTKSLSRRMCQGSHRRAPYAAAAAGVSGGLVRTHQPIGDRGNAAGRQAGLSAPTSHIEKYCDPPP
nr:hypothetical protein [Tsukamurella tyrosinosolvens]